MRAWRSGVFGALFLTGCSTFMPTIQVECGGEVVRAVYAEPSAPVFSCSVGASIWEREHSEEQECCTKSAGEIAGAFAELVVEALIDAGLKSLIR